MIALGKQSRQSLREIRERGGVGAAIANIQDRWFGPEQGPAPDHPEVRPEEVIRSSSFGHAVIENLPTEQRWSVEKLIGFLRSTSWRPDERLGDRFADFAEELDLGIRAVEPSGEWLLRDEVEVILARR